MGRLSLVIASSLFLLTNSACEKDSDAPKAAPPTSRGEYVPSNGAPPPSTANTKPAEHATAPHSAEPRKLCQTPPDAAGKPLPKDKLEHVESAGGAEPVASAHGRWTWVNLWASWCSPCKAEIPMLLAWQSKFATAGAPVTLDFVSLDDDRKQGQAFLSNQPSSGLKSSYWLGDGAAHDHWMSSLKVPDGLPVQLLFDPSGALKCEISGVVEESDYAQMLAMFSGK